MPEWTGIGDEGCRSLKGQISLHKALGWKSLEIRTIDGMNISNMPERDFEKAVEILQNENMKVTGFASAIANWSRPVTGNFETDRKDLLRSAPRMHRLGCSFLRIMSYTQGEATYLQWQNEAIKRIRELSLMAEDQGIILIHENCDGWASLRAENLQILLEEIPSNALKIVFDMGNPRAHGHPKEDVWFFLRACEDRIVHIHIKDCYLDQSAEPVHCFPGEGECYVREIISYMIKQRNYSGYLSIEPHMISQFHKSVVKGQTVIEQEGLRADNYLEYGRKAMSLVKDL